MRHETQTVRVGEYLGPVDWSFDFAGHCGGRHPEDATKKTEMLRQLSEGGEWEATTDGGWPRVGWQRVLEVGMYDGWPYWRPVPSVLLTGVLRPEWHSFDSLTDINRLTATANVTP